MPETITPEAAHYHRLDQRVTGLESSVKDIASGVKDLAIKLDGRSQTPWAVIWSAIGVMAALLGALGSAFYSPVAANMTRLETEVGSLRSVLVPRQEHQREWARVDKALTDAETSISKLQDRELDRLTAELKRLKPGG